MYQIQLTLILFLTHLVALPLKVLTFNIWDGGSHRPLVWTQNILDDIDPDIIVIQETKTPHTHQEERIDISRQLLSHLNRHDNKWTYKTQGWRQSIFSKHRIDSTSNYSITIDCHDELITIFNIHLHYLYNPADVIIEENYTEKDIDKLIACSNTRLRQIHEIITEWKGLNNTQHTIIAGDFNEPSHLDWTEAVVQAGKKPFAVEFVVTKSIEEEGFIDAFRETYPNPMETPGNTWSPIYPSFPQDRIDFIFYQSKNQKLTHRNTQIIGPEEYPKWPSDHRAVMTTFEISN